MKIEGKKILHTDVLIIGGGTAGCYAAMTIREQSDYSIIIAEKANIKRSGCLAAGVNALNAYITKGHVPQDYVDYATKDADGIVRPDLLLTMSEGLNRVTAKMEQLGLVILKDENGEWYKLCYTESYECKIKNSAVVPDTWKLHGFGGIPIVEFPNNHERLSDIELVIDLLDAINNTQSNRMDGIEQFIQAWYKFVNCEVDEEQFKKMKMNHALVVKSINKDNKSDVDVMSQELDQTQTQVSKDDLTDSALSILGIPNKQGNTGGDTQGAVELRNGWDFSKSRARLKDPVVKTAEKRLAKVALNVIRIKKEDLKITLRDFDVQINHSPQDNMYTKSQTLLQLLQCGIHPLIAIKTVGLWGDCEKTFNLSKPYLDALWKTADIINMEEQMAKAQEIVKQMQNKTVA